MTPDLVREGDPDELGLGTVDQVPKNPPDARCTLFVQAMGRELLATIGAGAAHADSPYPSNPSGLRTAYCCCT
jgi:hypothetical protein